MGGIVIYLEILLIYYLLYLFDVVCYSAYSCHVCFVFVMRLWSLFLPLWSCDDPLSNPWLWVAVIFSLLCGLNCGIKRFKSNSRSHFFFVICNKCLVSRSISIILVNHGCYNFLIGFKLIVQSLFFDFRCCVLIGGKVIVLSVVEQIQKCVLHQKFLWSKADCLHCFLW